MYFDRMSSLYLQASEWIHSQIPLGRTNAAFEWDSTPASKNFVWHDCYDSFKCARLQVPMDWSGTSDEASKTVEIAVIKVEATVPVTDPTYGGAVVLNPGGPGGSGIGQVLRGGHHVRTILSAGPGADNATAKNYDILGFDPRGINNTRPLLTCFPNLLDAAAWSVATDARGAIDSSSIAFDNVWASLRALADGCSKRAASEGIAKHMSTAPVARDIVEIFERHGEWRENEVRRLLSSGAAETGSDRDAILARSVYQKDAERIQYWGFSYGTVLGATLSTMYPERISRALLDAVADSHDYMAAGWSTNLRDTDMLIPKIAEYCYEGGASNCAIWDKDGPAVIIEKVAKAFAVLEGNPISVPGNGTLGPEIVTSSDLSKLISLVVYNPLRELPMTAQVMSELLNGEGTTLAAFKKELRPATLGEPLSEKCHKDGPYSPSCHTSARTAMIQWEATYGIACSDGGSRLHETKEEYREYTDKLLAQSRLIGTYWATIMLPCTAWHARAHWRYEGNFHNKTAHPILFVGNTFDPVTPLYNAFVMAKGFDGAGILHLNSEGHCIYASPSMCAGRAIREYFQTGALPGKKGGLEDWDGYGAFCEPDRLPFDGYDKGSMPELPQGETDLDLWEALVSINQVWP